jgi:hypothetical protein
MRMTNLRERTWLRAAVLKDADEEKAAADAAKAQDVRAMEQAVSILDALSLLLEQSDTTSTGRAATVKRCADRLHSVVQSNPAASGDEWRSATRNEWLVELSGGLGRDT